MTDMNRILQVMMRSQRREIVRIVIHVMAIGGLAGPTVATAIMCDDPIAIIEEKHHLSVPVISGQRPAVAENDGLTFAPVLVENFRTVLGLDETHVSVSFRCNVIPR